MNPTISPCPFCGKNVARLHQDREYPFLNLSYFVRCTNLLGKDGCGASGPHTETETEAIASWNRRAIKEGNQPNGKHV